MARLLVHPHIHGSIDQDYILQNIYFLIPPATLITGGSKHKTLIIFQYWGGALALSEVIMTNSPLQFLRKSYKSFFSCDP